MKTLEEIFLQLIAPENVRYTLSEGELSVQESCYMHLSVFVADDVPWNFDRPGARVS